MKKLTISSIFLLLFVNIFSQNNLKIEVFYLSTRLITGYGGFGGSYERKISKQMSICAGIDYRIYSRERYYFSDLELRGTSIITELRIYFKNNEAKTLPTGFYSGVFGKWMFAENFEHANNVTEKGNIYGIGIDAGYKFKYKSLSIEPLLGYAIGKNRINDFTVDDSFKQSTYNLIRFEILVGFEF